MKSYSKYPIAITNNAKKGIALNKMVQNSCATPVGKARARQLANKKPLSLKTISRMYSYLSRAETYYNPKNKLACGTISYLLWGGLAAKRWTYKILKQNKLIKF